MTQLEIEKAASALAKEWLEACDSKNWVEMTGEEYEKTVKNIFLLGAEHAKPRWIKCSERMPTTDKRGVPANSILAYGLNPRRYNQWFEKYPWLEKCSASYPFLDLPDIWVACYVPEYGFLDDGWYFRSEPELNKLVTQWTPILAPEAERK